MQINESPAQEKFQLGVGQKLRGIVLKLEILIQRNNERIGKGVGKIKRVEGVLGGESMGEI